MLLGLNRGLLELAPEDIDKLHTDRRKIRRPVVRCDGFVDREKEVVAVRPSWVSKEEGSGIALVPVVSIGSAVQAKDVVEACLFSAALVYVKEEPYR
jgi:hypothetical protein